MPSRSATEIRSSAVWMSVMPFARLTHARPRSLKTLASAAPPLSPNVGSIAGGLERVGGDPDREIVSPEAIALVALLHLGLDLAFAEAGGERDRVEHLLDHVRELPLVVRSRLGQERAPLRNDVRRRPALDEPDVRRRLFVEATEP